MAEYLGERFHERQVIVAVSRERMTATWALTNRLMEIGYYVSSITIVEYAWVNANWNHRVNADDPAALLKLAAWGPVARVTWDELTQIDRATFTDRWLRTVACGMAYGPGLGGLKREEVEPTHFAIHDDVLGMFDSNCEIRHSYAEEVFGGGHAGTSVCGATFDTCFVLRDANLTGVFVFGEED